jgi:hypothetical protein
MKSNFYKLGIVAVIFIALVIVYFSVLTGRSANTYEMLQPSGGSSAVDPSTMVARNQPQDGKPMRLSTLVLDDRARPVAYQTVDFAMKADFLGTSGVLDLGQAKTDNQGIAVLDYTPRISGQTELITSYGDSQTSTPITIANSSSNLYQATSGIHLPTVGSEVFVGTQTDGNNGAPPIVLRLPGGTSSWLLLFVAVIMLVWSTYFRAFYQVFQVSAASKMGTSARVVPMLAMAGIIVVGSLLVLKIITGPFTHIELPH